MLIYEKMAAVMHDIGAIGKDQVNQFDRYNFRGIDDVYNALQPALVNHGVIVAPQVLECSIDSFTTTKGAEMQRCVLKVAHHFWASDGSSVEVTTMGEGADRGDKAVNKAHSSAYKTAMFQAFCIPTQEQSDSETDSPDLSRAKRTKKAKPAASAANGNKISDPQRKMIYGRAKERLGILDLKDESVSEVDVINDVKVAGKLESLNDLQSSRVDGVLLYIDGWTPGGKDGF